MGSHKDLGDVLHGTHLKADPEAILSWSQSASVGQRGIRRRESNAECAEVHCGLLANCAKQLSVAPPEEQGSILPKNISLSLRQARHSMPGTSACVMWEPATLLTRENLLVEPVG
jgi:hypothetical protein